MTCDYEYKDIIHIENSLQFIKIIQKTSVNIINEKLKKSYYIFSDMFVVRIQVIICIKVYSSSLYPNKMYTRRLVDYSTIIIWKSMNSIINPISAVI